MELIFPPYVLGKLCEDHVRQTYHPPAKLTMEWYVTTTEFFDGYASPAHPTGGVEYLVTVRAGRKVYCYAINGAAKIKSHYVKDGKRDFPLPAPDLLRCDSGKVRPYAPAAASRQAPPGARGQR